MDSYSSDTAPKMVSPFFSFSCSSSTGSPSRRVSHQYTYPSVETENVSVPVLLCSHAMSYTGSRCDFSIGLVSTGVCPLRTSKYPTCPLYIPHESTLVSFGL
eukprot:31200-Pelagococcus_subviridis.AAC.4